MDHCVRDMGVESVLIRDVRRSKKVVNFIMHRENNLCFVITEKKILVITPLQVFRLQEVHKNWWPRLATVKKHIKSRKVETVSDLVTELGPGIKLIPTSLDWYI